MKTIGYLNLLLVVVVLILSSCKTENEINDFDKRRANIIGDWSGKSTDIEIRQDTIADEDLSTFSITFSNDGKGIWTTSNGSEFDFHWLYQYNPEKIVIDPFDIPFIRYYDIIENEVDNQKWEAVFQLETGPGDKYKQIWELKKK